MKSEVRFLHKFLKSVGFSEYTSTRKIQELIKDVIMNADSRNYTTLDGKEDTVLVEFCTVSYTHLTLPTILRV